METANYIYKGGDSMYHDKAEFYKMQQAMERLFHHNLVEQIHGKWRFTKSDDRWLFIEYKHGKFLYHSILRADLITGRKVYRSGASKNNEIRILAEQITDYAAAYYRQLRESS